MNNENHSHTGSDNPENVIDEEYRDDDEAYYDDSETMYYDVSFDDDNVEAVYSYIDNETGEYREFRGSPARSVRKWCFLLRYQGLPQNYDRT